MFNTAKPGYEKARRDNVHLNYKERNQAPKQNKNRHIIWFNPPFNKNVATDVTNRFLNLLYNHFL